MSHIGSNIKKIRAVKKLSQAQFSEIFRLSRASVGAYEEGRSEPKIETLIQIASYFGISVDVLLTKELSVNEILSFDTLNQKLTQAHDQLKQGKKIAHDRSFGFVSVDFHVEYVVNHKNNDFISHLPKIQLPSSFSGKLRAFEMKGSEMEYHQQGLHHGDILICMAIELKEIQEGFILTVVTNTKIITRRVKDIGKNITLYTDDPNYDDIVVDAKSIREIWEVEGVISTYLNPPTFLAEKMLKLERRMDEMDKRIKQAKK